jgi:hypothetical protein
MVTNLIFLVIGLMVGWIAEWAVDWFFWRNDNASLRAEVAALKAKNRDLTERLTETEKAIRLLREAQ